MLKDMTEQEKKEFVQKLQETANDNSLKFYKRKLKNNHIMAGIMAAIIGITTAVFFSKFGLVSLSFVGVGIGSLAYYYGINLVQTFGGLKKLIGKCSDGKLSYRDYKKMVKSGEFDRIVNEINGKTSTVPVQDKIEKASEEGVTLSREEVEILRKMISKKSPGVVQEDEVETGVVEAQEETTQVNEEETQTTPIIDSAGKDDGRDA